MNEDMQNSKGGLDQGAVKGRREEGREKLLPHLAAIYTGVSNFVRTPISGIRGLDSVLHIKRPNNASYFRLTQK